MKEIPLTQGRIALVDDADFVRIAKQKWTVQINDGREYAVRTMSPGKVKIYMHREVLGLGRGCAIHVDHANGNGLDNQRRNLRKATSSQNQGNQLRYKTKNGFKGVCREPNRRGAKKFVAYISGYRKRKIGAFATPEEAAYAYDTAARDRYGEFACVNFPRPGERSALTGEIVPKLQSTAREPVSAA